MKRPAHTRKVGPGHWIVRLPRHLHRVNALDVFVRYRHGHGLFAVGLARRPRAGGGGVVNPPACPQSDRRPVISGRRAARHLLVPRGATRLWLCRYRGVGPASTRPETLLQGRRVRNRHRIRLLTHTFNHLASGFTGPVACPTDDGSQILAAFGYPHGKPVTVTVELTGCRAVTNGHVRREAMNPPGPALLHRLEALVP